MKKSVEDFTTPELYQKHYVRTLLMKLLELSGGEPVLFRAVIHRGNQGSHDRGYCTHLKVYYLDEPLSNTFRLTQRVMVEGVRRAIAQFFREKPVTKNKKSSRGIIFVLAYPDIYTSAGDVRCGIRLAFDRMEKPFCIGADPDFLEEASRLAYSPPKEHFVKWPAPYPQKDE